MNDITDGDDRDREASGRFVLRIAPDLHARLRSAARAAGLSLNEYCGRRLSVPGTVADGAASAVLERSAATTGDALVGVIAFGSWARGAATDSSDLDVAVVVGTELQLERRLYRAWDALPPIRWEGHLVEPHFLHLPELPAAGAERIGGLWAELAVDGVILFDREFTLARRLVRLRQQIVAGRLVRRRVHGQSYWVEAA